jgi:hypothetical protein
MGMMGSRLREVGSVLLLLARASWLW